MPNDTAISIRGLSKAYTIAHNQAKHTLLGEALLERLRRPFGGAERETFWALRDVSFDVKKGEVVGIIGSNGAGKSTLLKVLSRITEPTAGEVRLYGRVGSLLEVGTGFHPELTGRENIYLNGAILGMKRREIDRQFDAIVDFAEVEQFLDTPVKRYSSGMYVRLAFAVAAHLNPEILIVDEVLAVGDVAFQKKCLGKMQDVSRQEGRTVLFVSHNMAAVENLCGRAVLVRTGRVAFQGPACDCTQAYRAEHAAACGAPTGPLGEVITHIRLLGADGEERTAVRLGEAMSIAICLRPTTRMSQLRVGVGIDDCSGTRVTTLLSHHTGFVVDEISDVAVFICDVPEVPLAPGVYSLRIAVSSRQDGIDQVDLPGFLQVVAADYYGHGFLPTSSQGPLLVRHSWRRAVDESYLSHDTRPYEAEHATA